MHGANDPASSLQLKLPSSSEANTKVGDLSLLGLVGPEVIEAVGWVVSIVHSCLVSGPVFPAESVALTTNVCVTSARFE